MSINPHNGWPKKALDKLAQAERLRHSIQEAVDLSVKADLALRELTEKRDAKKNELTELNRKVQDRRDSLAAASYENIEHMRREVNSLVAQAKELKNGVPQEISEFISCITAGVDYNGQFQVLWWNKRFVIMRLSGRKCWNGRGMSRAYIKAETKIYDLEKYRKSAKREGAFGALDMERDCTVHKVEGRLSQQLLKDWKEEADYKVA